jgi:hypothetical protein
MSVTDVYERPGIGRQQLFWLTLALVLVFGLMSLPFYAPVTLVVGNHLFTTWPFDGVSSYVSPANRHWGVFSGAMDPPGNSIADEDGRIFFQVKGKVRAGGVWLGRQGFVWLLGSGTRGSSRQSSTKRR